jgi:phosphoglycolate phosphatase-like HAD superfamily hydrolase
VRPARSLAIFDVDGTLTRTQAVDGRCFVEALALELAIADVATDWSAYVHTTDLGIAGEIVARHTGRAATAGELARVRARCARLLAAAVREDRAAFDEVPGAADLMRSLRTSARWEVAIATGGWRACARLKLRAARIDVRGVAAAFAEDGPARVAIVRAALARAGGAARFARIVSVGDALWDVRAARELGLPFLGVATKGAARALRTEGATEIVADLRDPRAVSRALARARVPLGRGGHMRDPESTR